MLSFFIRCRFWTTSGILPASTFDVHFGIKLTPSWLKYPLQQTHEKRGQQELPSALLQLLNGVCGAAGARKFLGLWRPVATCQGGLAVPIETFSRKSRIGGDDERRIQDWRDDEEETKASDECETIDD